MNEWISFFPLSSLVYKLVNLLVFEEKIMFNEKELILKKWSMNLKSVLEHLKVSGGLFLYLHPLPIIQTWLQLAFLHVPLLYLIS